MHTCHQHEHHQHGAQFQSKTNSKDCKQKWTILELPLTTTPGI